MVWTGTIKVHINNNWHSATETTDTVCDVEASKKQTTSNLIMLESYRDMNNRVMFYFSNRD